MRIAIIGTGNRGQKLLNAAVESSKSCKKVQVVAAHDPMIEQHRKALSKYSINIYDDLDTMLKTEKIDIAIVAVPHHNYLSVIRKLVERGIHIIKEKPFACSPAEAEELSNILKGTKVQMMIATQRRFDPHYQIFKSLLPRLGKISRIKGSYTMNIEQLDEGWRANQTQSGGGALMDMGYHFIDLLLWYFGYPAGLSCYKTQGNKAKQQYDVEDTAILNFEYASLSQSLPEKTIGTFTITRIDKKNAEKITVYGQNGTLVLTPEKILIYDQHSRLKHTLVKSETAKEAPLVNMIDHFVHFLSGEIDALESDYRTHYEHVQLISTAYAADKSYEANNYASIKTKLMMSPPSTPKQSDVRQNSTSPVADGAESRGKKPDFVWPILDEESQRAVLSQLNAKNVSIYNRSGIIEHFEKRFAVYHGRQYALTTNSATSAIHAMYYAIGLVPGDEVLVPSNTFHATISPLMHTGAIPVFCDCLPDGNIDPEDMRRKITSKTKAAIVTHLWGIPCEMDVIADLCKVNSIRLLEDCSHAHGARFKGKLVGTFGDAAVWSFNGPKTISGGEGGILLTDDKEIEIRANILGQYNKRTMQVVPKDHPLYAIALTGLGLKHRATSMSIALANQQFDHLDEWLLYRRQYANQFRSALKDIPFIRLPDISDKEPGWYAFPFYFDSKTAGISQKEFIERCHAAGLSMLETPGSTCPQFNLELYVHPSKYLPHLYSEDPKTRYECPKSVELYNKSLKIPMWSTADDIMMVNKYIDGFKSVAQAILAMNKEDVDQTTNVELTSASL